MNVNALPIWIMSDGVAPIIFFSIIIMFMFIGSYFGNFRIKKSRNGSKIIVNTSFMSAIYGLTAVLLAFSFSTAVTHFDKRQDVVLQEVRTISDAYDATTLLGSADQLKFQDLIRNYLDGRIKLFTDFKNPGALDIKVSELNEQLKKIKKQAFIMVNDAPSGTNTLADNNFLSSIEKVSEAFGQEALLIKIHPPPLILRSLAILIAIVAFLSGYSMVIMNEKDWILGFIFALVMMGAIFVITNLEFPHASLLNLDDMSSELVVLRRSM